MPVSAITGSQRGTVMKITFDVETTGLDYAKDSLLSLVMLFENEDGVLSHHIWHVENHSDAEIKGVFSRFVRKYPDATWVAHNIKFDLHMLNVHPIIVDEMSLVDTTILYHYHYPRNQKKLGSIENHLFGSDLKSSYVEKYGKDYSKWPKSKLLAYQLWDVKLTHKLLYLQEDIDERFLRFQERLIKTLYRMEYIGFPYNEGKADEVEKQLTTDLTLKMNDIITEAINHDIDITSVNLNSSKQVSKLFYGTLGIPKPERDKYPFGKTYDGWFTTTLTNKNLLQDISHPIVQKYLDVKATESDRRFLKTYKKHVVQGRIHPNFNATGAITGRLSCSAPNLMNIKKKGSGDTSLRSLFVANEGEQLVSIDYKQQEIRMLAWLSEDEELLRLCESGHDMHSEMGRVVFGDSYNDEKRTVIKNLNFG